MTVQESVSDLLELRTRLPRLVGSAWSTIGTQINDLLDQLEQARSDGARRALLETVFSRLFVYPDVRRALATQAGRRRMAGDERRFAREFALEERSVFRADEILDPGSLGDDEGDRGAWAPTGAWAHTPPQSPGVIERTPHIDVDALEPMAVGTRFEIRVYLDTEAPHPGEEATTIVLPDLPELQLRVWLIASDHFSILGEDTAMVTVRAAEDRSTVATFTLGCVQAASGDAGIAATFAYGIRPAGSVWRTLQVLNADVAQASGRQLPAPAVRVDASAHQPDLVVQVLPDPDGDERHFVVKITSPRLQAYAAGVSVPWRLPAATKQFVDGYFQAFTTSDRGGRRAALVGAGRTLFRATPPEFQGAVWQLAALAEPAVKSIFVVTSEPHIPWELMIPNDTERERPALGVEFSVGRWVDPQHAAPQQEMPIVDSYVIAPTYRGSKALGFSPEEAQYVIDAFHGELISPALLSTIDATLSNRGVTLLHLICHGVSASSGQILDLDPDERLLEIQLEGLAGVVKAVREKHPFVFINACQVGQPTPALVGTGGFAAAFTQLGARCVVAPIWSVKDCVAGLVARAFYDAVRADPAMPFAAVLRDIRRLAYEGDDPEDSYAAYCFYGDPLAAQAPS